ncbi:NAD-dependent epimerase/dehydratase family protein [Sediminibacterium sp.]|uniref:polysaccharide biosynthesis C-terminal domain-containing protein n=1 Tax=Sediminibacterium sp. TaxID=1917865 RepID=UPI0025D1BAEB|nr:NAD-dependent epimerase/dehydratase family protein [Sediminibacterium sp.]
MKRIGITGQNGFVGKHLFNFIGLQNETFQRIDFEKSYFDNEKTLDNFVSSCDVIIHLAGMNRHGDPQIIYNTNVKLAQDLVNSLKRTGSKPHIIFSSSSQEDRDNLYGKSKKEARLIISKWAEDAGAVFTGMVIPNVFGPFGNPFYNSVVATFCHQITHGETPKIDIDGELKLIYVGELVAEIVKAINLELNEPECSIAHTATVKVSEILALLLRYHKQYQLKGIIPEINNNFELNLFNSFRCYEEIENKFPIIFTEHTDNRGAFTEIIRLNVGGQVSFSTTHPGITRGNHFHTRKIERFAVINGEALIQLRQIGTDKVLDFYLSGSQPAYVDMPIWYTHNIKNIGDTELYTIFWINEFYNPEDPDTYFENV